MVKNKLIKSIIIVGLIIFSPWLMAWGIGLLSAFFLTFTGGLNERFTSLLAFSVLILILVCIGYLCKKEIFSLFKHLSCKRLMAGIAMVFYFLVINFQFSVMGWMTRCDDCGGKPGYMYAARRVNPLFPFYNIGQAYINDTDLKLPPNYVVTPFSGRRLTNGLLGHRIGWNEIMRKEMAVWIVALSGIESIALLSLLKKIQSNFEFKK